MRRNNFHEFSFSFLTWLQSLKIEIQEKSPTLDQLRESLN